MKIKILGRKD